MGGNELGSSLPGKAGFQPDLHVTMFSISVSSQLQIKLHIYEIKSRENNLNRNTTHYVLWIQHQGDFVKALGELHGHERTIELDDENCLGSSCLFSMGSFREYLGKGH